MLDKPQATKISEVKIGAYKKSLLDVHRWQVNNKTRKTPVIRFLSWLFGN